MATPFAKTSFAAGEISPSLWGRIDLAKYHVGASTMRNFLVNYRGGAMTRAGTAFVGQCKQPGTASPPRDIRFQFNVDQGYILEFGETYMRVKSDGGYVLEPAVNITGVTNADPCQITASTLAMQNGNLANGDWVFLAKIGGTTQLNLNTYIVQNVNLGAKTFTLTDLFGNAIDSTGFGVYTSGGTLARLFTLATPYAAVDLPWLKSTQSADVMTLCCVNQNTGTEYPPYDLARITASEWTLTQSTFAASISAPTSISVVSANSGSWMFQYVVTAVSATTGDESVASLIGEVDSATNPAINANTITVTWAPVTGASHYNIYRADPALSSIPVGALFYYVGTAVGTQFQDSNITADVTSTPPTHQNPFSRGAILSVQVTAPGSGLTQNTVGYSITTSTGSGAVLQPIVVNGSLAAVIVENGGSGYQASDSVTITPNTATAASGSITFTTNPTNGENIVLNGVTWTFVTSVSGNAQTQIGSTLALTLAALAGGLGASSNSSLTVASYRASATVLSITYNTTGTGGNSYTLSVGTTTGATASGATLTGGSGTGSGATAVLTIGPETGTYPGGAAYFQQRRYYFNTLNQPDTYFGSQPGSFLNMDFSIPITDSDAITGTPWAQQVNGIQSMVPMSAGLVILTGSGAWLLTGGVNSSAVTPSNQDANAQAYNGISPLVPAIPVNYDVLYVQEKGSIVRDAAFNFFVNVYTGTDKTELSNHLFTNFQLLQWAYAEEPFKVIWTMRNDGILLSLTYLKEEDIYAWARHDTNGLFVSVASVTEPPVDAVYAIVKRYIQAANNGAGAWVYYAERFNNRTWQYAEDAWCVDAGLSYDQNEPAATLTPAAADGTSNITAANVAVGGAGYVAPVATAFDPTNLGNGAVFVVTVVAGSITAVTPTAFGQDYSPQTEIRITDSGGGAGAVVYPVITNIIAFKASAGVFSDTAGLGAAGDVIRVGGGIATVTEFVSSSELMADVTVPITAVLQNDPRLTPIPQASGEWSIINPISEITNLNHLEGMTVSILADGGVVSPQVVTDGTITLPQPASQVIVGLPFLAQLQTLLFSAPGLSPTDQGRRKNAHGLTIRTNASRALSVGVNQPDASTQPGLVNVPWVDMIPMREMSVATPPGLPIELITGDTHTTVQPDWDTRGQIAIQISDPLPAEILMVVPEMEIGDDPGP